MCLNCPTMLYDEGGVSAGGVSDIIFQNSDCFPNSVVGVENNFHRTFGLQ